MRLPILLHSWTSANVRAFPLTGEGRLPLSGGDVERSETEGVGRLAAGQTDEGAVKGLLYFTNQSFLNQLLIPGKGKGPINHLFQSMNQ